MHAGEVNESSSITGKWEGHSWTVVHAFRAVKHIARCGRALAPLSYKI